MERRALLSSRSSCRWDISNSEPSDSVVSPHALCAGCREIFSNKTIDLLKPSKRYTQATANAFDYHDNFESWDASIAEGCHFCSLLSSALRDPVVELGLLSEGAAIREPLVIGFAGSEVDRPKGHIRLMLRQQDSRELGDPLSEASSDAQGVEVTNTGQLDEAGTSQQQGIFTSEEISLEYDTASSNSIDSVFDWNDDSPPDVLRSSVRFIRFYIRNLLRLFGVPVPTHRSVQHHSRVAVETSKNTGSNAHLTLAKSWLAGCLSSHPHCRGVRPEQRPRRLVRISHRMGVYHVRVEVNADDVSYFALSHRWSGGKGILKLTTVNESAFQSSIPWDLLPKTFRDAVKLTIVLGLEHIWIDSLCILQNSHADFLSEGSKMSEIYGNAQCVIAASGANDATEGLFFDRNPLTYLPCRVQGNDRHYVRVSRQSEAEDYTLGWNEIRSKSTLFGRGWCFQERVLAPRLLYFGRLRMYWECNQGIASEWEQDGLGWKHKLETLCQADLCPPASIFDSLTDPLLNFLINRLIPQDPEDGLGSSTAISDSAKPLSFPPSGNEEEARLSGHSSSLPTSGTEATPSTGADTVGGTGDEALRDRFPWPIFRQGSVEWENEYSFAVERREFRRLQGYPRTIIMQNHGYALHRAWYAIVSGYCQCSLSKPSDKVIALSGVANRLTFGRSIKYVCGLWQESLILDLLWFVTSPQNIRVRQNTLPSWTWASMDGGISSWPCSGYRAPMEADGMVRRLTVRETRSKDSKRLRLSVLGYPKQAPRVLHKLRDQKYEIDSLVRDIWPARGIFEDLLFLGDLHLDVDPGYVSRAEDELSEPSEESGSEPQDNIWLLPVLRLHKAEGILYQDRPDWAWRQSFIHDSAFNEQASCICGLALAKRGSVYRRLGLFHLQYKTHGDYASQWFNDVKAQYLIIE